MIGQAIIVLGIVGFLLLAAEVFVPGMVLGVLGGLCLAACVALCYVGYGSLLGTLSFAALAVLLIAGFFLWLNIFPGTPIGKKLLLKSALRPDNSAVAARINPGATGEALTPLRPAGTALIAGRRVDVVAESGLIEPGEKIEVVLQDGLRVVVRGIPEPA
ncbi:MAG: NfeD family protein [Verrucomicrobiae bacterium]